MSFSLDGSADELLQQKAIQTIVYDQVEERLQRLERTSRATFFQCKEAFADIVRRRAELSELRRERQRHQTEMQRMETRHSLQVTALTEVLEEVDGMKMVFSNSTQTAFQQLPDLLTSFESITLFNQYSHQRFIFNGMLQKLLLSLCHHHRINTLENVGTALQSLSTKLFRRHSLMEGLLSKNSGEADAIKSAVTDNELQRGALLQREAACVEQMRVISELLRSSCQLDSQLRQKMGIKEGAQRSNVESNSLPTLSPIGEALKEYSMEFIGASSLSVRKSETNSEIQQLRDASLCQQELFKQSLNALGAELESVVKLHEKHNFLFVTVNTIKEELYGLSNNINTRESELLQQLNAEKRWAIQCGKVRKEKQAARIAHRQQNALSKEETDNRQHIISVYVNEFRFLRDDASLRVYELQERSILRNDESSHLQKLHAMFTKERRQLSNTVQPKFKMQIRADVKPVRRSQSHASTGSVWSLFRDRKLYSELPRSAIGSHRVTEAARPTQETSSPVPSRPQTKVTFTSPQAHFGRGRPSLLKANAKLNIRQVRHNFDDDGDVEDIFNL